MGFFEKQSEYQADTNSVEFDRLQNRENVVIVIEMNMEREILTVCVSFHRKDDKKGNRRTDLIVVLVNTSRAEVLVTSVLLDGRLRPATERVPIRERWVHIVVSIPQRQIREGRRSAHDRVPLACTGVDACKKYELR